MEPAQRIAVIVPTLNEVQHIPALAPLAGEAELVIADGGSSDGTVETSRRLGLRLVSGPAGRGTQMNAGAAATEAPILLFLHADTRLPAGWQEHIHRTLALPGTSAGAFGFAVDASGTAYRVLERLVRLRPTPYGDQAIFLRRSSFATVGGYPEWAALEDVELIRRLRMLGRIRLAPAVAVTSGRRWHRLGLVRATLLNQKCLWAWRLGYPPARIARWRALESGA